MQDEAKNWISDDDELEAYEELLVKVKLPSSKKIVKKKKRRLKKLRKVRKRSDNSIKSDTGVVKSKIKAIKKNKKPEVKAKKATQQTKKPKKQKKPKPIEPVMKDKDSGGSRKRSLSSSNKENISIENLINITENGDSRNQLDNEEINTNQSNFFEDLGIRQDDSTINTEPFFEGIERDVEILRNGNDKMIEIDL